MACIASVVQYGQKAMAACQKYCGKLVMGPDKDSHSWPSMPSASLSPDRPCGGPGDVWEHRELLAWAVGSQFPFWALDQHTKEKYSQAKPVLAEAQWIFFFFFFFFYFFFDNKLQHFQNISLGGFSHAMGSAVCWAWFWDRIGFFKNK